MVAMADLAKRLADADTGGALAVVPEGSSPINDSVISLKPGGGIFGQAPEVSRSGSSTIQYSCLGEPWDEAGLESSWSPLNCSAIWQCQALLLELQIWQHCLGLPKLKGTSPQRPPGGMGGSQSSWVTHCL